MGGNALAPYGARRVTAVEYRKYKKLLYEKFGAFLETLVTPELNISYSDIPYYSTKPDFGDLDFLVTGITNQDVLNFLGYINCSVYQHEFSKKKTYFNPPQTYSFLFEDILQVDIILVPEEDFYTSLIYYAYNDLGNLLGKIYNRMGLKYGHRGLTYSLTTGTEKFDEILVSKNHDFIYGFLGLPFDRNKYLRDKSIFPDLNSIFEFVKKSKYFHPDIFIYENLNHKNRIRDKKRNTYRLFLDHLKSIPIVKPPLDEFFSNYFPTEEKKLQILFDYFSGFEESYKYSLKERDEQLRRRGMFNGVVINEITGLEGKDLSLFMESLRKNSEFESRIYLSKEKFHLWIKDEFDNLEKPNAL